MQDPSWRLRAHGQAGRHRRGGRRPGGDQARAGGARAVRDERREPRPRDGRAARVHGPGHAVDRELGAGVGAERAPLKIFTAMGSVETSEDRYRTITKSSITSANTRTALAKIAG